MRACCAPLCVLSVRRPMTETGGSGTGAGGRRRTRITLTSPFIGGSDLYATRFSDRFRAFSLYSLHSDFFREEGDRGAVGTPSDFCFDASRCSLQRGKKSQASFFAGNRFVLLLESPRSILSKLSFYPASPLRSLLSPFERKNLFLSPLFLSFLNLKRIFKYLGNFCNNLIPQIDRSVCRGERERKGERIRIGLEDRLTLDPSFTL